MISRAHRVAIRNQAARTCLGLALLLLACSSSRMGGSVGQDGGVPQGVPADPGPLADPGPTALDGGALDLPTAAPYDVRPDDASADRGPVPFDATVDRAADAGADIGPIAPDSSVDLGATADAASSSWWLRTFRGRVRTGRIAVDGAGNLFVTAWAAEGEVDLGGTIVRAGVGDSVLVASFTPAGEHRWSRTFVVPGGPQSGVDFPPAVVVDHAGRVHIAGYFQETMELEPGTRLVSAGSHDAFIASFDNRGNLLGAARFGDAGSEAALDLAVDGAGRLYIAGGAPRANMNTPNTFLLALDEARTPRWSKWLDTWTSWAVTVDSAGNSVFAIRLGYRIDLEGTRVETDSAHAILFASYDPAGGLRWTARTGGDSAWAAQLAADAFGNVYVTGRFTETMTFDRHQFRAPRNKPDAFVASLDGSGKVRWATQIGAEGLARGTDVAVAADGSVVAVGELEGAATIRGTTITPAPRHDVSTYLLVLGNDGLLRAARAWSATHVFFTVDGLALTPGTPAGMVIAGNAFVNDFEPGPATIVVQGQPLRLLQTVVAADMMLGRLPL